MSAGDNFSLFENLQIINENATDSRNFGVKSLSPSCGFSGMVLGMVGMVVMMSLPPLPSNYFQVLIIEQISELL